MPRIDQLSAGEAFDDQTGQPLGEGFLMLKTSAGNRVLFRSPAELTAYQISNAAAGAVGGSDQGLTGISTGGASGGFNDEYQVPTTT